MGSYEQDRNGKPFRDYTEYMQYMFDCVNGCLDTYISKMKVTFANGEGGYKNVLYPDIELAGDACKNRLQASYKERFGGEEASSSASDEDDEGNDASDEESKDADDLFGGLFGSDEDEDSDEAEDSDDNIDDDLMRLLGNFASENPVDEEEESETQVWDEIDKDTKIPVLERLRIID